MGVITFDKHPYSLTVTVYPGFQVTCPRSYWNLQDPSAASRYGRSHHCALQGYVSTQLILAIALLHALD